MGQAFKRFLEQLGDIGLLTTDLGAVYMHGGIGKGTEIAFNTIYNDANKSR